MTEKYTKEQLQEVGQSFLFMLHSGDMRTRLVINLLAQSFNTHPQIVWDKIIEIANGTYKEEA